MGVQNAFACGSGPEGSIPMHLARNDRFEKDWTPLMIEQGFEQEGTSNWYRTPSASSVCRDLDKIDSILAESEKLAA
jgi:hypothetical protein